MNLTLTSDLTSISFALISTATAVDWALNQAFNRICRVTSGVDQVGLESRECCSVSACTLQTPCVQTFPSCPLQQLAAPPIGPAGFLSIQMALVQFADEAVAP